MDRGWVDRTEVLKALEFIGELFKDVRSKVDESEIDVVCDCACGRSFLHSALRIIFDVNEESCHLMGNINRVCLV